MRELLSSVFSRASALALAVAAGISAALGWFTSNWVIALIIGLSVLLAVLLLMIVVHYVRRERAAGLEEGLGDRDAAEAHERTEQDDSRLRSLEERFQESVDGIKADFRGRGGVYELPWLLVLGEVGAGKSTLLAECGLDLPAQFARRGFGPTDTLEFVRANELIALDLSGRYLACETEQDTKEWQRLLALLRKHRPDRSLEGILVAVPLRALVEKSAAELEALARALRLRLNEIRVRLHLDAPVYIVVTKADEQLGFAALARLLPPQQLAQAFGWTNDQRRLTDPDETVVGELRSISERLDALLPELLMREPDDERKRALFVLPQDLEAASVPLGRFVGVAFKRDVYSESTPFLRGVYFASARAEAPALSATLERMGAPPARRNAAAGQSGALFLRDLILDVIKGDSSLAQREATLGPLARRAIQSAAAIAALWLLWAWGTSFWQNHQGTARLAERASALLSTTPSASEIDALRGAIEEEERTGRSPLHWLGFRNLWEAVDAAKQVYTAVYDKSVDRPTKARLQSDLAREDEAGVQAAILLAADIDWLSGEREDADAAPKLESFAPRLVRGLDFNAAYVAFSRWLPQQPRDDLIRGEQEDLAAASGRLLKLPVLEEITSRPRGPFPPLRRSELGFGAPDAEAVVPGIYTAAGRERLIGALVGAIDRSGSVSGSSVAGFKREFAKRHDEVWRAYLLDLPLAPAERVELATSPYLVLLAQVDDNTKGDVPGREDPPAWLEALREVRRTLPLGELAEAALKGGKADAAPWVAYKGALDAVAVEIESAGKSPEAALALVHEVAGDKPTEFANALEVATKIVPRGSDAAAAAQLRRILEMPFLDAFSAIARLAVGEIDTLYKEQIGRKYTGSLSPEEMDELCGKGGDLDKFVESELAPFLRGPRARTLLEDRALPIGTRFAGLLDSCGSIRMLPGGAAGAAGAAGGDAEPGSASFTLTGVPSTVEGAPGLLVTSRVLELSCDGESEELRYSEGSATTKKFECRAGCELSLRVVIADTANAAKQQEVSRLWQGDTACQDFLAQGKPAGGDRREWPIAGPSGSTVRVKYRVSVPKKAPKPAAPKGVQIPAGLGG